MSKLFDYIKKKFINKSFLTFCIIGVLNTAINALVIYLAYKVFGLIYHVEFIDDLGKESAEYIISFGISTLAGFTISSIFSYYTNAKFTYNTKVNKQNALNSALAFIIRFVATYVLSLLAYELVIVILPNFEYKDLLKTIVNTLVSLALVPPFYLVFKLIFKGKDEEEK